MKHNMKLREKPFNKIISIINNIPNTINTSSEITIYSKSLTTIIINIDKNVNGIIISKLMPNFK